MRPKAELAAAYDGRRRVAFRACPRALKHQARKAEPRRATSSMFRSTRPYGPRAGRSKPAREGPRDAKRDGRRGVVEFSFPKKLCPGRVAGTAFEVSRTNDYRGARPNRLRPGGGRPPAPGPPPPPPRRARGGGLQVLAKATCTDGGLFPSRVKRARAG